MSVHVFQTCCAEVITKLCSLIKMKCYYFIVYADYTKKYIYCVATKHNVRLDCNRLYVVLLDFDLIFKHRRHFIFVMTALHINVFKSKQSSPTLLFNRIHQCDCWRMPPAAAACCRRSCFLLWWGTTKGSG